MHELQAMDASCLRFFAAELAIELKRESRHVKPGLSVTGKKDGKQRKGAEVVSRDSVCIDFGRHS